MVSHEEWLKARIELLAAEKGFLRIHARRRHRSRPELIKHGGSGSKLT
jgi:predicted dithiol-disulfide oxidoreductase (DUF899 family)